MLNINGKLLDQLNESEFYLLSVLLNYGKRSHPKNDVLLLKTGWGEQKLKRVKKSLKEKGILSINARFGGKKGRGRNSNQYLITTKLASKFNGIKQDDFHTVEIQLDENNTVDFNLDDFKRDENQGGYKVLKLEIIESIKLLKESVYKETHTQISKLKTENLSLKNQLKKEKEKNSAKKEKDIPPTNTDGFQKKYQITLSSYKFPEDWNKNLIECFLLYCDSRDDKTNGKWGGLTCIKLQIQDINNYLRKFKPDTVAESLRHAAKNSNTNYNPQWVLNRIEKDKQDEQPKQQTSNNKTIIENLDQQLSNLFSSNGDQKGDSEHYTEWSEVQY